jgi:two-component system, LytTR family, response regulator
MERAESKDGAKQIKKLAIPTTDGFVLIKTAHIYYCKAINNYTQFWLADGSTILSSYTLKFFEQRLGKHSFVRINRSCLVNLEHVGRYVKSGSLVLDNGLEIEVSRTYRNSFLQYFKDVA